MSLSRDTKAERKWKAARRKEFQLQQEFRRIDFEEDVLLPELMDIKAGRKVVALPENVEFDITVVDLQALKRVNDATATVSARGGDDPDDTERTADVPAAAAHHDPSAPDS